jgi:hypothetical protein
LESAPPRKRGPMTGSIRIGHLSAATAFLASLMVCAAPTSTGQVFVVQPEHIEQHYAQIDPTNVKLPAEPITKMGRERLIRFMQSEQGFAMRPLPVATIELRANGEMNPGGAKYISLLHEKGASAKPGDRLVVTNIRFKDDSIILDLNNGPDHKHKYLRHIAVGMGGVETPLAPYDDGAPPTGARITVTFPKHIPDISGEQLQALLKPLIDFGVKSPAEAYAESLPPFLRKAITEHRVLVGMDRDMVIYAKGQPGHKEREQVDGKNIEIWIYGEAPQPVEFVRFEGSFVVRTELAKVGEPVQVKTANEMGPEFRKPAVAANEHQVQLGDRSDADVTEENAPKAPPTLRQAGEKLPADNEKGTPSMAPVNFPPDQRRPGDPGYSPTVPAHPSDSGQQKQESQPRSSDSTDNPIDAPPQKPQ